ncbi:hypothetical protein HU200_054056 [Digitaria exilis]|uniref:Rx N-terminal domain-containing protein n=1 Tax=Digitaria exilis TaxID=1010633 RepID=A0A835E5Z2_9POAL|nr:hypothetical protein HU200_054056 [Digitaria exilis]
MDAQGALNSLLGRLTTVLADEAQLLGGIRGDVEFIKDEMESMNGLLLHLSTARHRDHQVRAWMQQVVALTRDSGGNIELYVHYVGGDRPGGKGFLGYICQIPRLVLTIPIRHRIAMRIRELKARAHDVGERRLRYGVTIPPTQLDYNGPAADDRLAPQPGSPEEDDDLRKRELLDSLPNTIEEGTKEVLMWLLEEEAKDGENWPRAIIIEAGSGPLEPTTTAMMVYNHPSLLSSFHVRAWVDFGGLNKTVNEVCSDILEQLVPTLGEPPEMFSDIWDNLSPLGKVTALLAGTKFIIVLANAQYSEVILSLISGFWQHDCTPGSALIATRDDDKRFNGLDGIFKSLNLYRFYFECLDRRAFAVACRYGRPIIPNILKQCGFDALAAHLFLRHLYASIYWSQEQMNNLERDLDNHVFGGTQTMLRFCFDDLPGHYKSCLLYLTIFPQCQRIGRTSLLRRWVAEGLITDRNTLRSKGNGRPGMTTLGDEAERIFDSLVIRGFLHPEETSATGKIKTFTVPSFVHNFIAGDLSFADTCLPPDLAYRLSINCAIKLHEASCSNNDRPFDGILHLLQSITGSFQWQLLKVLDLEGCRGLKKKHMKNICKILLLKFLSLRDTDVTELPKQIGKLQCLETLDIRQTTVQKLPTRSVMLQMLKHLLAGQKESSINDLNKSSGLHLPRGIQRMKKLQVLSCVEVSNNDNLNDLGHLLELRKLGVILEDEKDGLSLLFQQIEKLHGYLRSLSIQIKQPGGINTPNVEAAATLVTPPILLQSLKISGITSGLPHWIVELDQLEEITLSKTRLGHGAKCILGRLRILRCHKLLQESYAECNINFEAGEFQNLRSLEVVNSGITNMHFHNGTAPKLMVIYWSFTAMDALSGLEHLPKLKKLELSGYCNLDAVRELIERHPNHPDLKHTTPDQPQE